MADDSLESSAHVLVSLKEGSFQSSSPRRGNPPRIRKKNRHIYNDDEDTSYFAPSRSPKKQPRSSASGGTPAGATPKSPAGKSASAKSPVPKSPVVRSLAAKSLSMSVEDDKKSVLLTASALASMRSVTPASVIPQYKNSPQTLGNRLKNLLKLPKGHKWVCYEFFYSNLDEPLLLKENDFSVCLQESYPQLKTHRLRRVHWCKIRRLMGKPRRCSAAFFLEERTALEKRRNMIRLIQQRNLSELVSIKELPDEIPMHLVVGTKVTARLRRPQDGLFTGVVEAFDTLNNTYRVTFDRAGLGTHSIPDFEVLSLDVQDTIPLSAFQKRKRALPFSPPKFIPGLPSPALNMDSDPLLSCSPLHGVLSSAEGATYGGFPIRFLVLVTRLSKILDVKKGCIKLLKELNTEAEKLKSYQRPITVEFQKRYATVILEMEQLNRDLNEYLVGVQQFCQQMAPEQGLAPLDQISEVRQRCDNEALEMRKQVCKGVFQNRRVPRNEKIIDLVTDLTSLMLQIRTFADNEYNSYEFKSLQDTLRDVKKTLDANNLNCFQNNIEVHVNYVQSGLSQMGNLHAFASPSRL